MKYQFFQSPALKRSAVIVALATAYSSAWALETFTFSPSAVGLTGANVTADNIILSDFARVTFSSPTNFTEQGFLSITDFQLGGSNVVAGGLNSTYSLYFEFTGSGHLTSANTNPLTGVTNGVIDTLNYTLYGANGNATFGVSAAGATVNSSGAQVLGTGSLIEGVVVSVPTGGSFVPSAAATVSFAVAAGKEGFFSPQPFYNVAFSAFTNALSTVTPVANGFIINNGGGNLNFAAPIPEPETYALMLAGLGVMGFVARRRKAS
jgi:hypothetical protein